MGIHAKISLILMLFPHAIGAQMVDASGKRIDAFMVDEAPVLDGVLDDDAWAFATAITDLHQVEPKVTGRGVKTAFPSWSTR